MAVLWIRPRRRSRRGHVLAHRDRQAEQRRPRAWLADVLRRIAGHPASRLHELLPWNWAREWERTVKAERVTDALPSLAYPVLIDAVGRCPPEDVGGPWGYGAFLDALANPAHESHPETKEWTGEDFDPKAVNAERLADGAAALAKTWARTPAKRKPST